MLTARAFCSRGYLEVSSLYQLLKEICKDGVESRPPERFVLSIRVISQKPHSLPVEHYKIEICRSIQYGLP